MNTLLALDKFRLLLCLLLEWIDKNSDLSRRFGGALRLSGSAHELFDDMDEVQDLMTR